LRPLLESVPIAVLTGFLGSGKSTLLNGLLRSGSLPPTAIVINEFGEVAIDHALIEGVTEGVMLLSSGCVCCAVRSDLEAALRDLHLKRVRGLIPAYKAVILETTGLADPGPVLQTLTSRPVREMRYRLGPVIATLDAENGKATLESHHEAVRQIAIADRIILTKADLVPEAAEVVTLAREINPSVPIVQSNMTPTSKAIFGNSLLSDLPQDRAYPSDQHHHDLSGISSYGRMIEGALDWDKVDSVVQTFLRKNGEQVLRFKALLHLRGVDEVTALHGVHHTLYPPQLVSAAPTERISRVSLVGDNLSDSVAEKFLSDLAATAA
jgi:G3E family GTPase